MFYDERIEKEKGRICQGAMLLAVAFALPYWVLHTLYVFGNAPMAAKLPLIALDGVITLTGLVLLTVGLLRNRGSDEREQVERCRFYSKAAPWYLGLVGLTYAIVLPMQRHIFPLNQFALYSVDDMAEPLAFLVGVYLFYSFKMRDIYFNYSIMETDRYYPKVWKNIGKFALWLLLGLGISLATLVLLPVLNSLQHIPMFFRLDPENMGATARILAARYGFLLVMGTALYLFLSFLEKESYNKLSGLSRAAGWSLVVTAGLFILRVIVSAHFQRLVEDNLQLASKLSQYQSNVTLYMFFALTMFLIYFSREYQRSRPDRAMDRGCKCILLTLTLSTVLAQYRSLLFQLLSKQLHQLPDFLTVYTHFLRGVILAQNLLYLAGGVAILLPLIRHKILSRWHLAAIPAAIAALVTVVVLQQLQTEKSYNFSTISTTVLLVYLCILVFRVIHKTEQKDTRV